MPRERPARLTLSAWPLAASRVDEDDLVVIKDRTRPSVAVSVAFVALGVIWGTNFLFMKWAAEVIEPAQIVLLRVLFGFLPVLLFALVRRDLSREHLRFARHFLAMALLATVIYFFCFAAGTQRLPSSIAGSLSGMIPLVAFIATSIFLRTEPVTRLALVGVLCGFGGVVLIARPWDAASGIDGVGVAFMVLGSASVGLSFVYARRFLSRLAIPPTALTTYQMAIACLILLIVTPKAGLTDIVDVPRAFWGLVLGLGLLGTGIAYLLYYSLINRLGAVTASSATYIPPVVAFVIGIVVANDPVVVSDFLALALILAGVVLVRIGSRLRRS